MVTRFTLLKELSAIVPDDVFVLTSIGNNSGFWGQFKDREANLFHLTMGMCSLDCAGSFAGVAQSKNRRARLRRQSHFESRRARHDRQ